jgi:hypothetical protein
MLDSLVDLDLVVVQYLRLLQEVPQKKKRNSSDLIQMEVSSDWLCLVVSPTAPLLKLCPQQAEVLTFLSQFVEAAADTWTSVE